MGDWYLCIFLWICSGQYEWSVVCQAQESRELDMELSEQENIFTRTGNENSR